MNIRQFSLALCGFFVGVTSFAQVIYINDLNGRNDVRNNHFSVAGKPVTALSPVPVSSVRLRESLFSERYALNRRYLMSLDSDKLL